MNVSEGQEEEAAMLRAFLAGQKETFEPLYSRLSAVVHARVASVVVRMNRAVGRDQLLDVSQSIWMALCAKDFDALRRFRPDHPRASLRAYVGNFATWRAIDLLRRHPKAGTEVTLELADFEQCLELVDRFDEAFENRDFAMTLLARLQGELKTRGRQALQALYVEGLSTPEAVKVTGMSEAALNSWRRDIRRLARKLRTELDAHTAPPRTGTGSSNEGRNEMLKADSSFSALFAAVDPAGPEVHRLEAATERGQSVDFDPAIAPELRELYRPLTPGRAGTNSSPSRGPYKEPPTASATVGLPATALAGARRRRGGRCFGVLETVDFARWRSGAHGALGARAGGPLS